MAGARPEPTRASVDGEEEEEATEPGEWRHGWQYSASSILESRFRESALLRLLSPRDQAMLRSCSGPGAGYWLTALPTGAASSMRPALFQVAMRRRLQLRLLLGLRRCPGHRCRKALDNQGDHLPQRAAAATSSTTGKGLARGAAGSRSSRGASADAARHGCCLGSRK